MMQSNAGKWDYEFDIVIVGFGGAGGCAAVEAHDAGSKVVLLEKQPESHHYSNTRMSGGGFHSPNPSGDREALKAYAKAMFSGENIPWLFEGAQEEYSDGLASLWAEYAPKNGDFMDSLDPDHISTTQAAFSSAGGNAAFPDFPGAKESRYNLYVINYIPESENPSYIGSP
ncbi:MAG: FAD-binding protein, partial [Peptococcaceae bacterium]|nr:FAD-binding protein [Peptococcaceae bacterium]